MEVLPLSGVPHVEDSDCPQISGTASAYEGESNNCIQHEKEAQVVDGGLNDLLINVGRPQINRESDFQGTDGFMPAGNCSSDSNSDYQMDERKASCGSPELEFDDTNTENYSTESCLASENSHIVVDTIENEVPNNNREGELSVSGPMWLEGDETVALWVKWRGKWQAGIRCARADWPLSTLKAKPTHGRKKYYVIFFPHTRNYSWADSLLVCSIDEFPEPIAYKSHKAGLKLVEDVKVARRFIMKKLVVGMLNIIDQFHYEALIESARDIMTWKEFAMEASRCNEYSDLGRMLLKLQNMILRCFLSADWLEHSLHYWVQRCQNAQTAEIIEMLKEELDNAIFWNEVNSHGDAPVQPMLSSEWKTWKHEVTKWFSLSHTPPIIKDMEHQTGEAFLATSLQVSRKRPKLEVRRSEAHASLLESKCSNQAMALDIHSDFFNSQNSVDAATFASESRKINLREIAASGSPGIVPGRLDGVAVETQNLELASFKNVELTPSTELVAARSLNFGNKNRQCVAFIESKGRQCVRWANEGDVYCCVHLSSRFTANSAKKEQTPVESPMCQGTTVLGNRCKHRSLYGSLFCKKHGPRSDQKLESNSIGNNSNEKQRNIHSLETTGNQNVKFIGDVGSPLGGENSDVNNYRYSLFDKLEYPGKDSIASEFQQCIGSCQHNDSNPCLESPRRHSLYCEKHLPSWLKRARNGKSRVISKEVFIDILRDCSSQEQKVHLHQACELFYRLFKSILSLRNPVPMEVQFQWALSEASKDHGVGQQFMKLVSREKERLKRIWGFDVEEDAQSPCYSKEAPTSERLISSDNHDTDLGIRCKICSNEFLDDQALSCHFMDSHKKEAQWLFRGYACAICLDSFTNKKILETHVQERHHAPFVEQCLLLQCISCGSHFGNSEQLWLHVVAVHPVSFRLSNSTQQHSSSSAEDFTINPGKCNIVSPGNDTENVGGLRKFICKFCGLKFDFLPDLGRHHQAAHKRPGLVNSRPAKRGLHYYAYKLTSGKLNHPRFKKPVAAASERIRNRAKLSIRKHLQASKSLSTGSISLQPHASGVAGSRKLTKCSTLAKKLVSEIQKRKPSPTNTDIVSIAHSACCKVNFKVLLEQKFGVVPEQLYSKAAQLCGEYGVKIIWSVKGFVCPKGCQTLKDPKLPPPRVHHPNGFGGHKNEHSRDPVSGTWKAEKCDYVIKSPLPIQQVKEKVIILCADISFGLELVPVVCVSDEGQMNSLHIPMADSGVQNARYPMPWMNFTYIKKPMLDKSLAIDAESLQLGCACPHSLCSSETCDHTYLFESDYDDAKDIYGNPMRRRFPYDEHGRIILEEGYLVYECNQMCSCGRTCPNRVLQNGVQVKLEVFMTETKGWAVRAGEGILRGTFVCEYIGEVLDEQEANRRRSRYNREGSCYFLDVDARINDLSRLVEGSARYVIDATKYGNVSRFLNHSCSPNLVTYQVLVESMDYQRSHIGLYANRDVAAGEELTYDYRYELLPGEGHQCLCGSPNCRGRLY